MDFEQYFNDMKSVIKNMEDSRKFELTYTIQRPALVEDIREMEDKISAEEGMERFRISTPIKKLYQAANGFRLRWTYIYLTDEDYITCGNTDISSIYAIFDPEDELGKPHKLLYKKYRLFDWIGDNNHVALKFLKEREEPKLYYYAKNTNSYYKMSIDFTEYLSLMLEARALYPWQEFFIADRNFKIDQHIAQKFLFDLELLFSDADLSRFCL